jgi:hypothetical protein
MLPGDIRQSPSQTPGGYRRDRPSPGPGCAPRRSPDLTLTATPHARRPQPDRLPPIGPRSWCAGTRFRWSGACTATLSGAVSAGSNPAGGTGQRHKFEHLDNLGRAKARASHAMTCGNARPFWTLRPVRARKAGTGQGKGPAQPHSVITVARPLPWPQAVALPTIRSSSAGPDRARLSSPARSPPCHLADVTLRRKPSTFFARPSRRYARISWTPGDKPWEGCRWNIRGWQWWRCRLLRDSVS